MEKSLQLLPLKDIDGDIEFWKGTRFRQYGIRLNVDVKNDDFYEYILAEIPGETDFMLLTCVERYNSGSTLALVKTNEDKIKLIVNGKTIKHSMAIENIFLKKE